MLRTLAFLLAIAVLTPLAGAQDLFEGMPAPKLKIAKWVKGEPVKLEKGKVYVIDFWATWDGARAFSLPYLSELQDHYRGRVAFIGVTREDQRGNTLDAVEKMVADKGAGMGYTVAWDDQGQTWDAYMTAAAQTRLPVSFLVDKRGQIAFIGPPNQLDIPIARVLEGKWDPLGGGELMARVSQKVGEARRVGQVDPKAGVEAIDKLVQEMPELKQMLDRYRLQFLLGAGMVDAYYAQAREAVAKAIKYRNPSDLNQVAWTIVDPEGKISRRDLDLALGAAEKAVAYTQSKDAAILDTLARVWFRKLDVVKAIELQTQAVAVQAQAVEKAKADGNTRFAVHQEQQLDGLTKVLDEYKAAAKKTGDSG
ncbi:MAG: TlpA family protein disulfide reductase [Planctomycetota bacterium]|jgi:thiol-disulfide isomerase/thioredoxin